MKEVKDGLFPFLGIPLTLQGLVLVLENIITAILNILSSRLEKKDSRDSENAPNLQR